MTGSNHTQTTNNTARRGSDAGRLIILYEDWDTGFLVSVEKSDLMREFKRVMRNGSLDVYTYNWTLLEFLHDEAFEKQLWAHLRNSNLAHVELDDDEAFYIDLEIRNDVATEIKDGGTDTLVFGEIEVVNLDDVEYDCVVDMDKKMDIYYYENADIVEIEKEAEEIEDDMAGGDQFFYIECLLDDLLDLLYVKNPRWIGDHVIYIPGREIEYEAYVGDDGDMVLVRRW